MKTSTYTCRVVLHCCTVHYRETPDQVFTHKFVSLAPALFLGYNELPIYSLSSGAGNEAAMGINCHYEVTVNGNDNDNDCYHSCGTL